MLRFGISILTLIVAGFVLGANEESRSSQRDDWHFEARGTASGIDWQQRCGTAAQEFIVEMKSTGAALIDYDGDGRLDIFLTSGSTLTRHRNGRPGFGCRLYRNLGDLRFEDVTKKAGIPDLGWACGAVAADVDGDGRDDLLVTCIGLDRLLLNEGGKFRDVGKKSGLRDDRWSTSAAFGDLDGDGDLDLYVCSYLDFPFQKPPRHGQGFTCSWLDQPVACGPRGLPPQADVVYENLGDGVFAEAKDWGFEDVEPGYGLGVVLCDLVGDDGLDVFVANDSSANHLFESRDCKFVEVGLFSGVGLDRDGKSQAGMGVAAADLNGDQRFDLLVTNFENERNNAYINDADGVFHDRADTLGLGSPSHALLGWGIGVRDFDNDGTVDVFVANGHVYPQVEKVRNHIGYGQRDQLFVGVTREAGLRFEERGEALGLGRMAASRGAAFGDLDDDGDIDIVVCHMNDRPEIYENRPPSTNRSLTLSFEHPAPNRRALGARVTVQLGDRRWVRDVRPHSSFQCSNDARVHIGLGTDAPAGTATVRWPGGKTETFRIPAGGGSVKLAWGLGD